jgi:hypothetical protein
MTIEKAVEILQADSCKWSRMQSVNLLQRIIALGLVAAFFKAKGAVLLNRNYFLRFRFRLLTC